MCDKNNNNHGREGRRDFLRLAGTVGALGLFGGAISSTAYAQAPAKERREVLTRERRDAMTPDEVLEAMKRGNERFRKGKRDNRDVLALQRATAKSQHPKAVLLSCMDSRAPAETILDTSIGDIFNSRLAGNVLNEDVLGGMEFGCAAAGSKVVLVMGHTSCGAVRGAIDGVKLGNLTGLLAKIQPAITATAFSGERSSKNDAFVDAVAKKHVELTVADIRKRSSVLANLESKGKIKIVGSMYSLETGVVDFFA
ncbi:MAG: carbonic anhydrase family protein [Burkholderiales bacterium]